MFIILEESYFCIFKISWLVSINSLIHLFSQITKSKKDKYRFELEIVQQPIRARMCGLGDKDRRQISPPPFIKLLVFDRITNQPADVDDVDISSYVLVVELWSSDEKDDLSLNQNIITEESSLPTSPVDSKELKKLDEKVDGKIDGEVKLDGKKDEQQQQLDGKLDGKIQDGPTKPQRSSSGSDSDGSLGEIPTRNLIGNLVTNAFKLFDEHNEKGIWFVLHDLSVRIEGEFKLKFTFVNLKTDEMIYKFSQPFKVYSAKKFPGVVDSSQLGRVFASQGVKIPIRRDTKDR